MKITSLVEKPGDAQRASPLLEKAGKFGLDVGALEQLAIQRGCDYYHDGEILPPIVVSPGQFSNEELLVALLSPALSPTPRAIRLAAALLGTAGINEDEVAKLAKLENCADIINYIAKCGQHFELDNPFWARLLQLLPEAKTDTDQMPHPTRFVEMTGIDRGHVGLKSRWIRPGRTAV